MTMSERERRLLDATARDIEEQDPELAAALQRWSEPVADHVVRRRRAIVRWRDRFRSSERAPLCTALGVGTLFIVGMLWTSDMADERAPVPTTEVATFQAPFAPL